MRKARRSRSEWRSLVSEWQAGSESAEVFASMRDIRPETLKFWSRRLGNGRHGRPVDDAAAVEFVAVSASSSRSCGGALTVEFPGGFRVHVDAEFDQAVFRRVAEALTGLDHVA